MLQGAARVQPHPALGVLVRQEEPVLRRGAQPLDLGQLLPQVLARVHYRGLKWNNILESRTHTILESSKCGVEALKGKYYLEKWRILLNFLFSVERQ